MFTAPQVEEMIRETGGAPVVVGAVSTWGHLSSASKHRFGAAGSDSADGGTSPAGLVLSIPAGRPDIVLQVGGSLLFDGEEAWIRAFRDDPEGLQTRILLAERTHVVTIYRPVGFGVEDDYRVEKPHWDTIVADLEVNLEPDSGDQIEDESGVLLRERWNGFFPPASGAVAGDRVLVTAGFGPSRYRIDWVAPHGPTWDARVVLVRTDEEFP